MKVLEAVHRDWPVATEVRKLQSRIWRLSRKEGLRVIMITSAIGGEGKTTTTAFLGATLALHPGRRILVIDLDLRRPSLANHFENLRGAGLGAYLHDKATLEEAVSPTEIEGLDVLSAGEASGNPSTMLDSPQLVEAIDRLRAKYDLILLDTPPLVPVADASGLIPLADGVLLVVMAGKTPGPLLARARELCLGMGGKVLGLVVSNAEEAAPDTYGYRHYHSYYGSRATPREE